MQRITPRLRSSLLWGVVGALLFLALAQGSRLAVAPLSVGVAVTVGLALAVGAVVAAVSYTAEHRLTPKERT